MALPEARTTFQLPQQHIAAKQSTPLVSGFKSIRNPITWIFTFLFTFMFGCFGLCVCLGTTCMPVSHVRSLQLGLQKLGVTMWLLGTQPGSSARAITAFNRWANSSVSNLEFLRAKWSNMHVFLAGEAKPGKCGGGWGVVVSNLKSLYCSEVSRGDLEGNF